MMPVTIRQLDHTATVTDLTWKSSFALLQKLCQSITDGDAELASPSVPQPDASAAPLVAAALPGEWNIEYDLPDPDAGEPQVY